MNKVIELANKAGFITQGVIIRTIHSNGSWVSVNGELERFYTLARADLEAENAKLRAALRSIVNWEAEDGVHSLTEAHKVARAALGETK